MRLSDTFMSIVFSIMILYVIFLIMLFLYVGINKVVKSIYRKKREEIERKLTEKLVIKYQPGINIELDELKIFLRSISDSVYKEKVSYKDEEITEILERIYTQSFNNEFLKKHNLNKDTLVKFQSYLLELIKKGAEVSPYNKLTKREKNIFEDIHALLGSNMTDALRNKLIDLSLVIEQSNKFNSKNKFNNVITIVSIVVTLISIVFSVYLSMQ